jgi:hypothetical protein
MTSVTAKFGRSVPPLSHLFLTTAIETKKFTPRLYLSTMVAYQQSTGRTEPHLFKKSSEPDLAMALRTSINSGNSQNSSLESIQKHR